VNERVLLFSRANEIRGVDLGMPYYHTIPTISLPQVLSPSQLDFVAANRKIYWTDIQVNEVKRTGLTGGVTESIIDTGERSYIACLCTVLACTIFMSVFKSQN
jgi:integrin beta 2